MGIVRTISAPKSEDPKEFRKWFSNISDIFSYQTYTGDPTSNLIPRRIGDRCLDTTNNDWYLAYGTAAANWRLIT